MCGPGCNTRDRDYVHAQMIGSIGSWHDFIDSNALLSYKAGSMTPNEKISFEKEIEEAKRDFNNMLNESLKVQKRRSLWI